MNGILISIIKMQRGKTYCRELLFLEKMGLLNFYYQAVLIVIRYILMGIHLFS